MLNDWEKQRLDEIEHDLATDSSFVRSFDGTAPRWRLAVAASNALYPGALLAVALASMVVTTGSVLIPVMVGLGCTVVSSTSVCGGTQLSPEGGCGRFRRPARDGRPGVP